MSYILTNNEIRIQELRGVIPHCKTRKEAEEIQQEILELEEVESEVCPDCGSYDLDQIDDLTCGNDYHSDDSLWDELQIFLESQNKL